MTVSVVRGNALELPLADNTVDLVVTSPPYFGLRSYQDGGAHYGGQLGSEATPAEFVDALLGATAEMVRVVKGSGSLWVNLGDKYANDAKWGGATSGKHVNGLHGATSIGRAKVRTGIPAKSLIGIPWRYALRCIDELGLILRAEVIWSKPNGLPESVTDRVRRSHEQWFHMVKEPRYFSAVDEIREEATSADRPGLVTWAQRRAAGEVMRAGDTGGGASAQGSAMKTPNPLGKLPGSVWSVPTQPLSVPAWLGVDHFAAFPMEWPRRLVAGWSPAGVCAGCGEGRRPTTSFTGDRGREPGGGNTYTAMRSVGEKDTNLAVAALRPRTITGYTCGCPDPTAPTTPSVILDPFGGTGTTALVAHVMGRHGISVDLSADYCRLAAWRTSDPGQLAVAALVDKPVPQVIGQATLFEGFPA